VSFDQNYKKIQYKLSSCHFSREKHDADGKIDTISICLQCASSTDNSTTMVQQIVDSPNASLPDDCSPNHYECQCQLLTQPNLT